MSEKKLDLNARQIAKFANKASLCDAVDNITTVHTVKGTPNRKIQITVNHYDKAASKQHKEKFCTFYWDMDDAYLICHDILTNLFESNTYGMAKNPGVYTEYGGGQHKTHGIVSRVFNIGYKDDKFVINIALNHGLKGDKGQIYPKKGADGKIQTIDVHSVQLSKHEARKFFGSIFRRLVAQESALLTLENGQVLPVVQNATASPSAPSNDEEPGLPDLGHDFLSALDL